MIVHDNSVGLFRISVAENEKACFPPGLYEKRILVLIEQYTTLRDGYLMLTDKEATKNAEYSEIRKQLNESYDALVKGYGILNSATNRQRILKMKLLDLLLASLERKEGDQFFKADILTSPYSKARDFSYRQSNRGFGEKPE